MDATMQRQELDNYFVILNILDEHDLMNKPEQVNNVDEFGIPLETTVSTSCGKDRK